MSLRKLQADPLEFRKALKVWTDGGAGYLDQVADPWQRADFAALDGGWQRVVDPNGLDLEGGKLRGWLERPRGHSWTLPL